MPELPKSLLDAAITARNEVVAANNAFSRIADRNIQQSVWTLIISEQNFNRRLARESAEMKEKVGNGREETYALVLTGRGVSEATAKKVVAEVIAFVNNPA